MILTIHDLRARAALFSVIVLCGLVLAVLATGIFLDTGGVTEAVILAAMALGVWLERRRDPAGIGVQLAASAALAFGVAFIVWLMRGHPWQPDAHMMFFAAFALTAVFCDWRPIVLFAAIIAVHHLALNFLLTAAVYPGEASLARVLLHAGVLIVQAVPMIWVARVLGQLFGVAEANLRTAEEARRVADIARDEAEGTAARQARDTAEIVAFVDALGAAFGALSRGDLSGSLGGQVAGRFDVLRRQFDEMAAVIRGIVGQMEKSAVDLRDSADDLEDVARQNATQASEQADVLALALGQVQAMTGTAADASEHARATSERMVTGRAAAEEGGRVLKSAVEAMQRMEASSGQIESISKVMESIAFQTNLLALNAGVEAARAGDAGRGFAVVATEVRALAQRAAESAKDIQTLVTASRQSVAEGSQLVQQTSDTLGSLIRDTLENAAAVDEIARRAGAQTESLGVLVESLRNLDDATRKTAMLAERALAMSTSLKQDSQAMAGSTANFRQGVRAEARDAVVAFRRADRQPRTANR